MKHKLFYLSAFGTGVALKVGLALCLLGILPVVPSLVWAGVTLFIDLCWWVAVN
jgi:hypothetical protein